jgi:hypothetical protein
MHLCPKIVSFQKIISNELLPRLMGKTKQLYVLPALVECHPATTSFDLWMLEVKHDFLHW